jgi:thioredoxin-dependent peroxiredoxin
VTENELKIGDPAPRFCLPDQDGREISLEQLRGQQVVLYFYPKDNTSGCTVEALDFSAMKKAFESRNCLILGVSPDSVKSHKNFCLKRDLMHLLLSDTERSVLQLYGVWQKKKLYGREFEGVVRSTFLIDMEGNIAGIWRKVKVQGHAAEVLAALR